MSLPLQTKRKVTRPNFGKISQGSSKCIKCQLTAYSCDGKRPCGACKLHQHFCAYTAEATRRRAESVALQPDPAYSEELASSHIKAEPGSIFEDNNEPEKSAVIEAEPGSIFEDNNEPENSAVIEEDTSKGKTETVRLVLRFREESSEDTSGTVRLVLRFRNESSEDKCTSGHRLYSVVPPPKAADVPELSLSSGSQSAASMSSVLTPVSHLSLEEALDLAAEAFNTAADPKDCMACIRCQILEVSDDCDLDGPCYRCVQENGQCYYPGELAVDIPDLDESNVEA